ncbi:DnaJ domain-containing protein [Spiroplasma endosymbiont of Panorpa germanica]|uniref:DnaJ domain-containing protein n=1 Tax=Spiroplasma endosymbiont of Panorpa germanica TaxID=3066314 RepID=UPI0030CBC3AF
MGWKSNYKKIIKNNQKSKSNIDFNIKDSIPYFITWDRDPKQVDSWDEKTLMELIKKYQSQISKFKNNENSPEEFKTNKETFFLEEIKELISGSPAISNFQNVYNYCLKVYGKYKALLILLSITKFTYFTTSKFWSIYLDNFKTYNPEDLNFKRIFQVMQRTSCESVNNLLKKAIILVGNNEINQYRHHMLIEEIIESGEDLTFHWSRMLEQIIESCFESIKFENKFGKEFEGYAQEETLDNPFEEANFDNFFEKTYTMVVNDEVNEAFSFFGISKLTPPVEFKKVYRIFAKKYHPDVNSDEDSSIKMKKINIYKQIIEDYFQRYEIE